MPASVWDMIIMAVRFRSVGGTGYETGPKLRTFLKTEIFWPPATTPRGLVAWMTEDSILPSFDDDVELMYEADPMLCSLGSESLAVDLCCQDPYWPV
jgi:hypothetical protein